MSKNKNKLEKKSLRLISTRYRLSVKRSNHHIYAQIIDDKAGKTLVSSNSLKLKDVNNKMDQAVKVGSLLANAAKKNNIKQIYLDRGNLRYTGRLKSLCDSARKNGLDF